MARTTRPIETDYSFGVEKIAHVLDGEETGWHVSACDLNLVTMFDKCDCVNFVLYTTRNKLKTAASKSGEDVHLNKLEWRTAREILKGWHPEKISENIWVDRQMVRLHRPQRRTWYVYARKPQEPS